MFYVNPLQDSHEISCLTFSEINEKIFKSVILALSGLTSLCSKTKGHVLLVEGLPELLQVHDITESKAKLTLPITTAADDI